MQRPVFTRTGMLAATAAMAGVLLAGCASGDGTTPGTDGGADGVYTGWVGERPTGGTPVDGGTLSYATYSAVSSLDPANRQDGGSTGGTEMAAIYDLLMRYDQDSGEYIPQLAESLSANADHTVWTLTLRDGVTFSDGSPLDADAVVSSINRYLAKRATHAQVWEASVADTAATDPHTVTFTLKRPWANFPSLLTTGPGMIVAPTSTSGDAFTPIGAGPFVVQKFDSQNELVLTARPDYWGGKPHLDRLRFPAIIESQGRLDTLKAGGIQAAYIKNFQDSHEAIADGVSGWGYAANMTSVTLINSRPGRAGADPVVRKAITAAIDPDVLNTRVYGGFTSAGSAMFQKWSQWFTEAQDSKFDPDRARDLLESAKADGYDGHLVYVAEGSSDARAGGVAYKSMLENVGFQVELKFTNSLNDLIRTVYAEHDYDIANSGFNVLDEAPFVRLYGNLYSASSSNSLGYTNPDMDDALLAVQTATDEEDKRAALEDIQKLVDDTAPFVANGSGQLFIAMSPSIHDVTPSQDGILLFDDAWMDQA